MQLQSPSPSNSFWRMFSMFAWGWTASYQILTSIFAFSCVFADFGDMLISDNSNFFISRKLIQVIARVCICKGKYESYQMETKNENEGV